MCQTKAFHGDVAGVVDKCDQSMSGSNYGELDTQGADKPPEYTSIVELDQCVVQVSPTEIVQTDEVYTHKLATV